MITLKEKRGELFNVKKCMAQRRRLSEAEVEMDRKCWERRNSDKAPYETSRQLDRSMLC